MTKKQTFDGLQSLLGSLGDPTRDKAASVYYGMPVLDDEQLLNMYRGSWLARKIINIPAFDSVRRWRSWQAQSDQIEKIEATEKRLNVKGKILEARVKARLWGGAAIYIAERGVTDMTKPFDFERLGTDGIEYLTVMSRVQLQAGQLNTMNPTQPDYMQPSTYRIGMSDIHPSRLVRFVGVEHPEPTYAIMTASGWGDPVLLAVLSAVQNADSVPANVASLVFEANVDVIKIPDLFDQLSEAGYEDRLTTRFALASANKAINRSLMLDNTEDYDRKTVNFAGLTDIIHSVLQIAAGAADIPVTRLLGQSPAGLSATGDSDIRNYYDSISSIQELEMDPAMNILNESIIRSALGNRPPEIYYKWSSLWQVSDKERSEIGKTIAETVETMDRTGLFQREALANSAMNEFIEAGVFPGLDQDIEDAGGINPDEPVQPMAPDDPITDRLLSDARPMTLYISRKVINADELKAWARSQGFKSVQDDLHVTVIHTRTPMDWIKVGQAGEWSSEDDGRMTIAPGGPRLIERFGDAVVLQFASTRLVWRFEDIRRLGAAVDYPDYQPHVTITWDAGDLNVSEIQPYTGKIILGPEIFNEVDDDWKSKIRES